MDAETRLANLAESFKFHPLDVDSAQEYADYLRSTKHYREALALISSLPDELRCAPSIRTVLGDLYRDINWHAHAVSAYGDPRHLSTRARQSRRESWLFGPDPVGLMPWSPRKHVEDRENSIEQLWNKWCAERIAVSDELDLTHHLDLAHIRTELEVELLDRARLYVRRGIEERWARRPYVLPLLAGMAWLLLMRTNRLPELAAGFAVYVAVILCFLARRVIDRPVAVTGSVPRERRVERSRQLFGLVVITGMSLLVVAHPATWLAFSGGALTATAAISWTWLYPVYRRDWLIGRLRREKPREVILDELLQLLGEISDSGKRNSLDVRISWIARLEDIASMIEVNLLGRLRSHDLAIRAWAADWAADAAETFRCMEAQIAAPSAHSWTHLTSQLRHATDAVILGEFGSLKEAEDKSSVSTGNRFRWRSPVTFGALFIVVSLIAVPMALAYTAAVLHASADIIGGVLIATVGLVTATIDVIRDKRKI